ncbi:hypothetical protein GCK32_014879 [Trichostrongylus colubriformis]|uniref:Uncharacterized protein n=1 Tax=Trichostrongylus colubriformis TaxID=6319 RepID=A0AAN8FZ13_TRICO
MSAEASPRHRVFPHDPHCLERKSQIHPSQSLRPPLPPRSNQSFPSRSHTVSMDEEPHNEETTYDVLSSHARVSCDKDKESDWYDSPRRVYDILSPGASSSNISSSPLESTLSTTSLCEFRLSSSNPPCEISSNDYDCLRSGSDDLRTRTVSLNLSVLVEQVLFVEVAGRVCIPQMFYTLSTPGTPVNLVLRPTPFGLTFRLMKPIAKNKEIGIRLHKNKNRIASILPDSSAERRNIPVSMPSPLRPGFDTAVVSVICVVQKPFLRCGKVVQ